MTKQEAIQLRTQLVDIYITLMKEYYKDNLDDYLSLASEDLSTVIENFDNYIGFEDRRYSQINVGNPECKIE